MTVKATAAASNGKTASKTEVVDVSSWINGVTVKSIGISSTQTKGSKTIAVTAKATASNGKTLTKTANITATQPYNYGYTEGYKAGYDAGSAYSTPSVGTPYIVREWVSYEYRYRYYAAVTVNGNTYTGNYEYF